MLCCNLRISGRRLHKRRPSSHESPQELNYRRQTLSGWEDERTNLWEHCAYALGVPAGRTSRDTTLIEEEPGVRVVRAISSGSHDVRTHRASCVYFLVKYSCSSESRRYLQVLLKYDQDRIETYAMQTKVSKIEYRYTKKPRTPHRSEQAAQE